MICHTSIILPSWKVPKIFSHESWVCFYVYDCWLRICPTSRYGIKLLIKSCLLRRWGEVTPGFLSHLLTPSCCQDTPRQCHLRWTDHFGWEHRKCSNRRRGRHSSSGRKIQTRSGPEFVIKYNWELGLLNNQIESLRSFIRIRFYSNSKHNMPNNLPPYLYIF